MQKLARIPSPFPVREPVAADFQLCTCGGPLHDHDRVTNRCSCKQGCPCAGFLSLELVRQRRRDRLDRAIEFQGDARY